MNADAIMRSDGQHIGSAPVRLARQIARAIIEQAIPVGTHLGSLPEVAESHGVSVPTLRKAMTYLLEDGFVAAREGRGGGLVVATPPGQTAVRAMYLFFSELDLAPEQIGEARDLINMALAERAYRLVDAEDQRAIEILFHKAADSSIAPRDTIRGFDKAILAAAKQPVLALVATVLERLEWELDTKDTPDLHEELRLRRETSRAILGGNLAEAIVLRRKLRPMPEPWAGKQPTTTRLPDQIAASIKATIRKQALLPGNEIGQEKMLQEMYGVGRSTLRDALRSLERSGAIKINKGRGGGIFVGSAEPYAAAGMTSLYLSSIKLTFREQIESREILESRAAWLAAERITPPLRIRLKRAMLADADAVTNDTATWAARGTEVERLIAHSCSNPLIEFFTLALVDLSVTQARRQGAFMAVTLEDLTRRVSHHHGEIVDAILAGLPAKAAFKTRQYLKELGQWVS